MIGISRAVACLLVWQVNLGREERAEGSCPLTDKLRPRAPRITGHDLPPKSRAPVETVLPEVSGSQRTVPRRGAGAARMSE